MLIIAVPIDGDVIQCVSNCSCFAIAKAEGRRVKHVETISTIKYPYQPKNLIDFLYKQGVNTVLTSQMDAKLVDFLEKNSIEIVNSKGEYKRAINDYLNGRLESKRLTAIMN